MQRTSILLLVFAVFYLGAAVLCGCNNGRKLDSESPGTTTPQATSLAGTQQELKGEAMPEVTAKGRTRGQPNTLSGISSSSEGTQSGGSPSQDQRAAEGTDKTAQPIPFNMFAPPKADLPVVRQSETRQENEPVRLIGFVNVDKLKALLAFDGKMRAMEVGESYHDVEVVAIDPPKITLQRGNERWITALFDQPVVHDNQVNLTLSRTGPQVTVGTAGRTGLLGPQDILPVFQGQARTPGTAQTGRLGTRTNSSPNGAPPVPPSDAVQPPGADQLPLPSLPELPPLPSVAPHLQDTPNR